jgi:hypothetical protein
MRTNSGPRSKSKRQAQIEVEQQAECDGADLLPLFRLLARQPAKDHDFRTCPICKKHGITEI